MPTQDNVKIQATEQGLLISGNNIQDGKGWQARSLGKNRVLLDNPSGPQMMAGDKAGFGLVERNTYIALLRGLVRQKFDGVVSLDLGNAVKRLFFRSGELVFAGSNLMDDRLGEVIYREGLITLDQLTEAAVQVNRTTKFGKVLIENQVFSCGQLWDALRLQVTSIFQSTFLQEYLYVQVDSVEHLAPTLVSLDRETEDLIDDCAGYAAMVWQFRLRLDGKTRLREAQGRGKGKVPVGTFLGDTVELVSNHATIGDFLKHSKLAEVNSLCAIFDLVHHNVLSVENFDGHPRGLDSGPRMKHIKGLLDAYQLIIDGAQKAFKAEGAEFPTREIELFLDRQYSYRHSPIFVHADGSIGPEAIVSIYTKARSSDRQALRMAGQLESLVRFLLQIVGDLLPGGKGWEVKKAFQNMIT